MLQKITHTQLFYQYLKAGRVDFWTTAAVFLLFGEWLSLGFFPIFDTIILLIAVFGFMISGSFLNHIFDKNLDEYAGKNKIGATDFWNIISVKGMFFWAILSMFFSLFLLYYFLNFIVFIVGILYFLSGFFYSSPPLRLKGHPPFDVISDALFFSGFPFLMGWVLDFKLNNELYLYFCISCLVFSSVFLVFGVFDIDSDKQFGLKTTPGLLGLESSINLSIILFFITLVLSFIFIQKYFFFALSMIICTPFFVLLKFRKKLFERTLLISSAALLWKEFIYFALFLLTRSFIPLLIFIISTAVYIFYIIYTVNLN